MFVFLLMSARETNKLQKEFTFVRLKWWSSFSANICRPSECFTTFKYLADDDRFTSKETSKNVHHISEKISKSVANVLNGFSVQLVSCTSSCFLDWRHWRCPGQNLKDFHFNWLQSWCSAFFVRLQMLIRTRRTMRFSYAANNNDL